jgi:hypothetical protein
MEMPPGRIDAIIATIIDKTGLPPWEVANLTWLQIEKLYFPKRNEDGSIPIPEAESGKPTFDSQMMALLSIKGMTTRESWEQAVRDCCQKWGQPLPNGYDQR